MSEHTLQHCVLNLLHPNPFSVTSCCSDITLRHSTHKCKNFVFIIRMTLDLVFTVQNVETLTYQCLYLESPALRYLPKEHQILAFMN